MTFCNKSTVCTAIVISSIFIRCHATRLRGTIVRSQNSEHTRKLETDMDGTFLESVTQYKQNTTNGIGARNAFNIRLSNGTIYEIDDTKVDWVEKNKINGNLKSGETRIKIKSGSEISGRKINIQGGKPEILTNRTSGRKLLSTTGSKTVLVVRVKSNDAETTPSDDELSDVIFGTFTDSVTLKSQMADCSYDQLLLSPVADRNGTSTAITNGVVTVTIDSDADGADSGDMLDLITSELNSQFEVSSTKNIANVIVYCLPPGTVDNGSDDWLAFSYIGWYESVYNDEICSYLAFQMFSLGTNMNFGRSDESSEGDYGDWTGMMGSSAYEKNGPQKCYNPAKSYQSQWYSDGTIELDSSTKSFSGQLYGIADYGDEGSRRNVLIKIPRDIADDEYDYYIGYNRQTGVNSGTEEAEDIVTVVKKESGEFEYGNSYLVGKLEAGDSFVAGYTTIKVIFTSTISWDSWPNSQPGYAKVTITYDSPTLSPTYSPTKAKTKEPSTSPTPKPPKPSSGPSMQPTMISTSNPSSTPSSSPTTMPTKIPSSTPSHSPSISLSISPSNTPSTTSPTIAPSFTPSDFPSIASSSVSSDHNISPSLNPSQTPTFRPTIVPTKPRFTPTRFPPKFPPGHPIVP